MSRFFGLSIVLVPVVLVTGLFFYSDERTRIGADSATIIRLGGQRIELPRRYIVDGKYDWYLQIFRDISGLDPSGSRELIFSVPTQELAENIDNFFVLHDTYAIYGIIRSMTPKEKYYVTYSDSWKDLWYGAGDYEKCAIVYDKKAGLYRAYWGGKPCDAESATFYNYTKIKPDPSIPIPRLRDQFYVGSCVKDETTGDSCAFDYTIDSINISFYLMQKNVSHLDEVIEFLSRQIRIVTEAKG